MSDRDELVVRLYKVFGEFQTLVTTQAKKHGPYHSYYALVPEHSSVTLHLECVGGVHRLMVSEGGGPLIYPLDDKTLRLATYALRAFPDLMEKVVAGPPVPKELPQALDFAEDYLSKLHTPEATP